MSAWSTNWPDMPQEARHTLQTYLGQLRKHIGEHLEAVIIYGSLVRGEYIHGRSNINLLLMIQQFSLDIGQRCGKLHRRWGKEGIIAPLMMEQEELVTASQTLPVRIS